MAHIDDLVKQVSDPQLRAALMQQVSTLTSRKQFGLVFQEHSPESVRLPQQRVRTGDKVELRESKESATFHVISTKVSLDVATVVELDESGETVGKPQDMLKSDLVVIKPFGDPVYPGLRQVGEAGSAKTGQPTHVVINGENYHALQALEYTHAGKVDLIYIDPPYNTGAADWKYNDKYIDGQDAYRHSKWLSFMDKRLRIAKSLLKETGFIVLAIDDNENARLKMLADQVFGEQNFIANIVWQGGMKNNTRLVSTAHDYMLVYARNTTAILDADIQWSEPRAAFNEMIESGAQCWKNSGNDPETATALMKTWIKSLAPGHPAKENNRFYEFDAGTGRLFRKTDVSAPGAGPRYDVLHPVTGEPVKVPGRGWVYGPEKMQELIDAGKILFGPDHNSYVNRKLYLDESEGVNVTAVFEQKRTSASKHLASIFGDKRFPFPKDHNVLMRWFRIMAPKNAVIVDFFAGSGSTAEAVIRLNDEDGGTRQSILVTNNELSKQEDVVLRKNGFRPGDSEYEAMGVFHHVTMPRISTVLTGVREDGSKHSSGIDGQNATFFDLTYEDENLISLGNKFEAVAPLLWLQSGAVGELIAKRSDISKGESGYSVPGNGNYAVIFDTEGAADAIRALHDGINKVFVVTDSENDFKSIVANLPGNLKNNAQRLYSSYLRSFEINRG